VTQLKKNALPVQKVDNVGMIQVLEHVNLLMNHVLVPFDSLLEDNFDGNILLSTARPGFLDSTIRSRALLSERCNEFGKSMSATLQAAKMSLREVC
jgi:hypothetical protein